MCLFIEKNSLIPEVAETDIEVYKFGNIYNIKIFGISWEYFQPYIMSKFRYTKNHKQPRIRIKPIISYCIHNKVEKGYHAWRTPHRSNYDVGVFIIPKGTKYFIGNMDDIVAETLIYKGRYEE